MPPANKGWPRTLPYPQQDAFWGARTTPKSALQGHLPMSEPQYKAVIVGAGPAGLTAAYELSKKGQPVLVLESDPEHVGGISRTVNYHGYRFDIGGHRFFSKSREVEDLWTEILGPDMLQRPRSSKIYYHGQFYSYPLKPFEALSKLGLFESGHCILSFAAARLNPIQNPRSFEDWVVNQFGWRLFNIFFKTYTEKVWGMSCKQISADWAAQRIKGLSLGSAIKNALLPRNMTMNRSHVVKTLIDAFRYPRLGPGMMWEACAARVQSMGGEVLLGRTVCGSRFDASAHQWEITACKANGQKETFTGEHLVSSMPMRELIPQLEPSLPEAALRAGNSLHYRDFLTVGLILKDKNRFQDNWIYIHDPNVKVGRIQNYKSWSPEMVPDADHCSYGMEYFCFEGDGLWNSPDADLKALATKELCVMGLAEKEDVVDWCVIRQPKAYPVYDDEYKQNVAMLRNAMERQFPALHLVGRNGMHKYNNQDHAMMTAMLVARNILAGANKYDVWAVNEDGEYLENGKAGCESKEGYRCTSATVPIS
jgi:protoporphyrinogen oxidase